MHGWPAPAGNLWLNGLETTGRRRRSFAHPVSISTSHMISISLMGVEAQVSNHGFFLPRRCTQIPGWNVSFLWKRNDSDSRQQGKRVGVCRTIPSRKSFATLPWFPVQRFCTQSPPSTSRHRSLVQVNAEPFGGINVSLILVAAGEQERCTPVSIFSQSKEVS